MYNTQDTIAAISSGSLGGARQLLRISGIDAINAIAAIFSENLSPADRAIVHGTIKLEGLSLDAISYVFPNGSSYSGDLLIELSVFCSLPVAQLILERITAANIRLASPGEFTARAYLNGKIDLSQAEAVAEIVSSSNQFQLEAAENLLEGRLSKIVNEVGDKLLSLMSMLEAELDFCEEATLFITPAQANEKIGGIMDSLLALIDGSIKYETMISLPSVGIAGSTNAGKSSLLNALVGKKRSIVSAQKATTRDILTTQIKLPESDCVLFDCAGLSIDHKVDILDDIAQQAAIEAVNNATLVIFCIAMDSDDLAQDLRLLPLITAKDILYVATKCDSLGERELGDKIKLLTKKLGESLLQTSSQNANGLDELRSAINEKIVDRESLLGDSERLAVNQRHKIAVSHSIECVEKAGKELSGESNELAAIYLRDAYETLADLDQEKSVDEQMLDRIFSQFCIGK